MLTPNKQKRQNDYIREGAFAYLQNVSGKCRMTFQTDKKQFK